MEPVLLLIAVVAIAGLAYWQLRRRDIRGGGGAGGPYDRPGSKYFPDAQPVPWGMEGRPSVPSGPEPGVNAFGGDGPVDRDARGPRPTDGDGSTT